ncbi:MAG: hypothetical protein ABI199_04410 [Bacteroidia bacterium]
MDTIHINFFGIACRVIKGKFNERTWEKFKTGANKIGINLEEVIFEKYFFETLKIPKLNTWSDLGNQLNSYGLMDCYQSSIEIRINNRQKRKLFLADISNEQLLFPLYETSISVIDISAFKAGSLIAIEKEIGTIASYKFETDNFSLNQLQFTLQSIIIHKNLKIQLLAKLAYKGVELISKKQDTLVKERFVLM